MMTSLMTSVIVDDGDSAPLSDAKPSAVGEESHLHFSSADIKYLIFFMK